MSKRTSCIVLGLVVVVLVVGTALALAPPHDESNSITCKKCHAMHGTLVPRNAAQESLCRTCHNPSGQASAMSNVANHVVDANTLVIDCGSCHDPHSPQSTTDPHTEQDANNLALIRGDTGKYVTGALEPAVFQQSPSHFAFDDANQPWNGICQTCHTSTNHHTRNNNALHAHHVGESCTSCHNHESGFAAAAGLCIDCHNTVQGSRRQIVGTGGDFEMFSHHVGGAGPETTDCKVCHDMTQHQQGAVRVKDVDNPGTVIMLTDNPLTNSTEATKLTAFCLACHDSNGAGGSAPFSDSVMPPVVDNVAWAAASHNGASVSCYGEGQFGCHASAHGSEKRKLLAPYTVAPTPPENAEEEEGFCFSCHDSNGPASSNIQAVFAQPVRWVTDVVGDYSNLNLNDRHDVQYGAQSTSGAKVECTDCHDPHTANASNLLKSDPDPDDGRLPGTGQILAGADFQTEWCLDCHDDSFPATVTAPSTPLANVRSTHQNNDSHGIPTGNPALKSGYGWSSDDVVPCLACHSGRHISDKQNLFQLKDLVKSKDGSTDIPSDNVGFNYETTDNNIKNAAINGYEWCNTCHIASMGSKKGNCFSCHYHGIRY